MPELSRLAVRYPFTRIGLEDKKSATYTPIVAVVISGWLRFFCREHGLGKVEAFYRFSQGIYGEVGWLLAGF